MTTLTLWADGSGTTADKPGGWAYVLVAERDGETVRRVEGSGGVETGGTNNRMELTAVLEGLRALQRPARVVVHTDSAYVCNAFVEDWFSKWDRREWRKVKNADLWRELRAEAARHQATFEHVPGHAGVEENERCDVLANEARRAVTAAAVAAEPDAAWVKRVRLYLVSDLSLGEFGQTAETIAGHWIDQPVEQVQAALDALEAAGETWRDSKGYRSRTCPPSYKDSGVVSVPSSSPASLVFVNERGRRRPKPKPAT